MEEDSAAIRDLVVGGIRADWRTNLRLLRFLQSPNATAADVQRLVAGTAKGQRTPWLYIVAGQALIRRGEPLLAEAMLFEGSSYFRKVLAAAASTSPGGEGTPTAASDREGRGGDSAVEPAATLVSSSVSSDDTTARALANADHLPTASAMARLQQLHALALAQAGSPTRAVPLLENMLAEQDRRLRAAKEAWESATAAAAAIVNPGMATSSAAPDGAQAGGASGSFEGLPETQAEVRLRDELGGLLARCHKDMAANERDPLRRRELLTRSYDIYKSTFERSDQESYYTGINTATLALLLGHDAEARRVATTVMGICGREMSRWTHLQDAQNPYSYWLLATMGEALLIRGRFEEAAMYYARAKQCDPDNFVQVASTQRQLRLLVHFLVGSSGSALSAETRRALGFPVLLQRRFDLLSSLSMTVPEAGAGVAAAERVSASAEARSGTATPSASDTGFLAPGKQACLRDLMVGGLASRFGQEVAEELAVVTEQVVARQAGLAKAGAGAMVTVVTAVVSPDASSRSLHSNGSLRSPIASSSDSRRSRPAPANRRRGTLPMRKMFGFQPISHQHRERLGMFSEEPLPCARALLAMVANSTRSLQARDWRRGAWGGAALSVTAQRGGLSGANLNDGELLAPGRLAPSNLLRKDSRLSTANAPSSASHRHPALHHAAPARLRRRNSTGAVSAVLRSLHRMSPTEGDAIANGADAAVRNMLGARTVRGVVGHAQAGSPRRRRRWRTRGREATGSEDQLHRFAPRAYSCPPKLLQRTLPGSTETGSDSEGPSDSEVQPVTLVPPPGLGHKSTAESISVRPALPPTTDRNRRRRSKRAGLVLDVRAELASISPDLETPGGYAAASPRAAMLANASKDFRSSKLLMPCEEKPQEERDPAASRAAAEDALVLTRVRVRSWRPMQADKPQEEQDMRMLLRKVSRARLDSAAPAAAKEEKNEVSSVRSDGADASQATADWVLARLTERAGLFGSIFEVPAVCIMVGAETAAEVVPAKGALFEMKLALKRMLMRLSVGFGFCSLASWLDLLFAEAVLEVGAELSVVLPTPQQPHTAWFRETYQSHPHLLGGEPPWMEQLFLASPSRLGHGSMPGEEDGAPAEVLQRGRMASAHSKRFDSVTPASARFGAGRSRAYSFDVGDNHPPKPFTLGDRMQAVLDRASTVEVANDLSAEPSRINREFAALVLNGLAMRKAQALSGSDAVERIYAKAVLRETGAAPPLQTPGPTDSPSPEARLAPSPASPGPRASLDTSLAVASAPGWRSSRRRLVLEEQISSIRALVSLPANGQDLFDAIQADDELEDDDESGVQAVSAELGADSPSFEEQPLTVRAASSPGPPDRTSAMARDLTWQVDTAAAGAQGRPVKWDQGPQQPWKASNAAGGQSSPGTDRRVGGLAITTGRRDSLASTASALVPPPPPAASSPTTRSQLSVAPAIVERWVIQGQGFRVLDVESVIREGSDAGKPHAGWFFTDDLPPEVSAPTSRPSARTRRSGPRGVMPSALKAASAAAHGMASGEARRRLRPTKSIPLGPLPPPRPGVSTKQSLNTLRNKDNLLRLVPAIEQRSLAGPTESGGAPPATGPDGRQVIMSLVFADVVGFSKLGDKHVRLFVEHFLGGCANLLRALPARKQPSVTNTWGDAVTAIFSRVDAAGEFALLLADFVTSLPWHLVGLPESLNIRVSVHAGPLHRVFDPVWGSVNFAGAHQSRAARIEPITPPGSVYCSQAFAALASSLLINTFDCKFVGHLSLAKKYGAQSVYHVKWHDNLYKTTTSSQRWSRALRGLHTLTDS